MRRLQVRCASFILAAILASHALAQTTVPTTANDDVHRLIANLNSLDPKERTVATMRLVRLGEAAREPLEDALRSPHVEVRLRAWRALSQIPLMRRDDRPEVRKALEDYGAKETDQRRGKIWELRNMPDGAGHDALLRVFRSEIDVDTRWLIVGAFRGSDESPALEKIRRDFTGRDEDAPAAALAAWAWRPIDYQKTLSLFRRAIELDFASPTEEKNEVGEVYDHVASAQFEKHRFADLAELYRMHYVRDFVGGSVDFDDNTPLDDLFAFHARFGMQRGFAADILANLGQMTRPQILYCLAKISGDHGHRRVAAAMRKAAFTSGAFHPPYWPINVAQFLIDNEMLDDAAEELHRLESRKLEPVYRGNVLLRLATLDAKRGDELSAAKHLDEELTILANDPSIFLSGTRRGKQIGDAEMKANLRSEMLWHYVKGYRAKNDLPAVKKYAHLLAEAGAPDDIAIDAVPMLKELGMQDDAKQLFGKAYQIAMGPIRANPSSARDANNLAWFCARCDEMLDEALSRAQYAVSAEPKQPMFLDTLAEVSFRRGDVKRAIEVETQAAALNPNFPFYQEQLKRFRAAASK